MANGGLAQALVENSCKALAESINGIGCDINVSDDGKTIILLCSTDEKYYSEMFRIYSIGGSSEDGYTPIRRLRFDSDEQFNAFLKNS